MILLNTSTPFRFSPGWRGEGEPAPVFLLRAGDIFEREMIEAELAGMFRAGRVGPWELRSAFLGGAKSLLPDAADVDQLAALVSGEESEISAADRQLLAEAQSIVAKHWPEYRELRNQAERRVAILPALAFRNFCVGWEGAVDRDGEPLAFSREADGLVEKSLMSRLVPADMKLAGFKAYNLLYANDHEGNSERPSKSDEGRTISTSDCASGEAGTSPEPDGQKIPD